MRHRITTFGYRRWLITGLGIGQALGLRTKVAIGVAIMLVSFATKSLQAVDLAPVMYTADQPFGGLTQTYDLRAVSILEGQGILGPYDVNRSRTVWLAQAPGYSIFLSAVYRFSGRHFLRVQLIQNLVNSLSPILLFVIAGLVVSWRVGSASGLLAGISHHLSHISNFILPDSITALPLLAAILMLALAYRRRSDSWLLWAGAGLMLGGAAWLRSQLMLSGLFLAGVMIVIAVRRRRMLKQAALLAFTTILAIAPITVRNYLVYGAFVPINIGLGVVLWEGIADASGDRFGAVAKDDQVAIQEAALYDNPRYAGSWSTPDGIERDRDRVAKSLEIIRCHPIWYAGVMLRRIRGMLKYSADAPLVFKFSEVSSRRRMLPLKPEWESLATDESSLEVGRTVFWFRPIIRSLQRLVKEPMLYLILVGAGIIGAASFRRALFLGMTPLYYFLFQSFMHTEFRYTLPMQYFMFVFAAVLWVLAISGSRKGLVLLWRRFHLAT